jgi:hypothetical protein
MAKPHGQVLWERFDRYCPLLLRLLARHRRGAPLTVVEISQRSGLSPSSIEAISLCVDWRGIDLPTARAFMRGVGIDLTSREDFRRVRMYLRTSSRDPNKKFPYLRRTPEWKTLYLPLLERLASHLKQSASRRTSEPR